MRYSRPGLLKTMQSSLHAKFVLVLSAIAIMVGALSAVDLAATERSLSSARRFLSLSQTDIAVYDRMNYHLLEVMIAERDLFLNMAQRDEVFLTWQTKINDLKNDVDGLSKLKVATKDFSEILAFRPVWLGKINVYHATILRLVAQADDRHHPLPSSFENNLAAARMNIQNIRIELLRLRDQQDLDVEATAADMAQQAAQSRALVIIIGTSFLLAMLGTVLLFPGCVTRPLSRLCEATDWIAAGDLTTRVKVDRTDEIGRLAVNFNGMANTIEKRTVELEQKNQRLELAQKRLRNHARRIERMRRNAQHANEAKSEFLARMSHEIRTPLAATLGFADLLLDQCDSPEQMRECVRVIQQNGQHLLAIINDILDLSKIEAGKLTAEMNLCNTTSIFAEVASLMRFKAQEKGLAFKVSFQTPIPEKITTDPTRLRQILLNLVNNAIKFTPHGTVELRAHYDQEADGSGLLYCDVRDEGIGMTPQQIQELFRPFVQVHQSQAKYGGTGLGLAISQSLAKLLGGDLTVTSSPGHGSIFHLKIATGQLNATALIMPDLDAHDMSIIPIPPPSPDAPKEIVPISAKTVSAATSAAAATPQPRVLVAEDTPALRRYMEIILTKANIACELVETGPDVVERVNAAQRDNQPYTVILLDLLLPGLDGFEVLRKIQSMQCKTPVIALTAHAMRHVQEKCMAAGFVEFVTKPVDRAALITLIEQYARYQNHHNRTVG